MRRCCRGRAGNLALGILDQTASRQPENVSVTSCGSGAVRGGRGVDSGAAWRVISDIIVTIPRGEDHALPHTADRVELNFSRRHDNQTMQTSCHVPDVTKFTGQTKTAA